MDLTSEKSFGVNDGVGDHLGPVIPQSTESIPKLRARLMSFTHAIMRSEYFMCLLL